MAEPDLELSIVMTAYNEAEAIGRVLQGLQEELTGLPDLAGRCEVVVVDDITDRQRAMLDFAVQVSEASHKITEDDREALRTHGFTDQERDGFSKLLRSGFVDQVEYLAYHGQFPFWYRQVNRNLGAKSWHKIAPYAFYDHISNNNEGTRVQMWVGLQGSISF